MRVEEVAAGGPAEEAGIRVGDLLLAVEGEDVLPLGIDGTRNLVRGEEGTHVNMHFSRNGSEYDVSVERRSIETPVVTGELLDGSIGYVKIDNFDERSAAETIAFVKALIGQGAEALLFDVRFNPGGYADELVKVLDYLLPEGDLFRSVDYAGREEVDTSDASCVELPMAVLVNEDSYSAAEFFAAALRNTSGQRSSARRPTARAISRLRFTSPMGRWSISRLANTIRRAARACRKRA